MSELALATLPTPQAIAAKDRSAPLKVTGKLKTALACMVWEGLKRPDAAAKAGMSDHGLREALRRPHVKQHYLSQLEVLRTSERARNIHTLAEVRDQKTNQMARVNAVKALEQISDVETAAGTQQRSPGVVIIVQTGTAHAPQAPNQVHVIDNVEGER